MTESPESVPLSKIMNRDVVTVDTKTKLYDVASKMTIQKIGAVVVLDKGKMAGIFTERDLLTKVVYENRNPAQAVMSEVMTRSPQTLRPDQSVADAYDMMSSQGFRHVPIVDGDKLVGIVSIRDIQVILRSMIK